MTSDITGLLRQLIYVAAEYGKELWIGDMDAQTAFDEMRHRDIATSLRNNGASAIDIFATMREFLGSTVTLELPGQVQTDPTALEKRESKVESTLLTYGTS